MKTRLMVAMAASLLLSCGARADEIKLLASAGLKAAYLELLPQFERESGHKVAAEWSSSPVIRKRIEAGEEADVVIVANVLGRSLAEELTKQGKIAGAPVFSQNRASALPCAPGHPNPISALPTR